MFGGKAINLGFGFFTVRLESVRLNPTDVYVSARSRA